MKTTSLKKPIIWMIALVISVAIASQVAASEESSKKDKEEIVYSEASLKNFAKTYWRFSKFELSDNKAIDNFMKISECDLYREYIHNEFEWNGIRESTRNFLEKNKKKFPDRYAFIQPMSLGDYDFEKKEFEIVKEHALNGIKSFEIASGAASLEICGSNGLIKGYPRIMALELTRPLIFNRLPMDPNIAQEIIAAKMENYENLSNAHKKRENYLKAREVYLVAKVKMFAHKPGKFFTSQKQEATKMLGIIERIEIYEDIALSKLLYKKDFRRKKKKKKKDF